MPQAAATKFKLEVFKPGTHTCSGGTQITFTAEDLKRIADTYNQAPPEARAPAVIGHPAIEDPAYGWLSSLSYNATTERLEAEVDDLEPQFAGMVQGKRFPKVSMAFFGPAHPSNPSPGIYWPRHLGFLGAAAPAIAGLKSVAFGAEQGEIVTIEFGVSEAASAYSVKSILRGIRDYFVEKHGADEADKIIPGWQLDNLEIKVQTPEPSPAYTAATVGVTTMPAAKTPAELEAENATLTNRVAELERAAASGRTQAAAADASAFCAQLVTDKRLTPADRPALEASLVALAGAESITFSAEGGASMTESPLAVVKRVLSGGKQVLDTTEKSGERGDGNGRAAGPKFAAPEGADVDTGTPEYRQWQAAKEYQRKHGCDFAAALAAIEIQQ